MSETPSETQEEKTILELTKESLDIPDGANNFDIQITMFINSVLSDLTSLGIGPVDGFEITDAGEKWSDFLGVNAKLYAAAKSYMFLRMRLLFDPPTNYFVVTSFQQQIDKAEWKLNVVREEILAAEAAAALLLETDVVVEPII